MGAYSELDMERQYKGGLLDGDDPFAEDDPFMEDDEAGYPADQPAPVGDGARQTETVPAPAPSVPAQMTKPVQADGAKDTTQAEPKFAGDKAAEEDAKRKAHEEAEAKRKAEWEAEQKKKKADELLRVAKVDAMTDEEVLSASIKRISADTEKLTRRNMMECVMEHIQTLCLSDPALARKVMHPRKNMIRCYQYINRKAWEYVQDEMKARGITPGRDTPSYSSAIPEGVCYQWAVDYFNDPDAKEDHVDEEKFVPKPYPGTTVTSSKKYGSTGKGKSGGKSSGKSGGTKDAAQKDAKPVERKKQDDGGQIAFGGFAMPEDKAG